MSARFAALAAGIALAGCVEHGDFGRPTRSVWNGIVAETGALAASARDEPVSPFGLTDDERLLRDRAWRFLVPAHDADFVGRIVGELVATRMLPPAMRDRDHRAYFETLADEERRSPASRYRRVSEDAAADERLVGPFGAVALRVIEADRVRIRTLSYARDVAPADIEGAQARVAENRCIVAWVRAGLAIRVRSYRYALEHLVIETPQSDAVPVERALAALDGASAFLAGLPVPPLAEAACLGELDEAGVAAAPRRAPPALPLVRKG